MLNLVILGGGKGERLKNYFKSSKILLKIHDKTLLELNLNFFKKSYKWLLWRKNNLLCYFCNKVKTRLREREKYRNSFK